MRDRALRRALVCGLTVLASAVVGAAQEARLAAAFDAAYGEFETTRVAVPADDARVRASARSALHAFLRLDPTGSSALERSGRAGFCAEALGEFGRATELYEAAVSGLPGDEWTQTALLRALLGAGRADAALDRARALATDHAAAVDAFLLAADGRLFDEAARRLRAGETAIGLFPFERLAELRGGVGDLANLALSLRLLGRTAEATACYEAALAVADQDALTWNDLGLCRVSAGDLAGAIEAFAASVRFDSAPGAGPGLTNLALLARQGTTAAMPDVVAALRPVMARRPEAQLARWLYLDALLGRPNPRSERSAAGAGRAP